MTRINNPKTYFKYFVLILPFFVLLSCTKNNNDLEPKETKTYAVTFNTNGGSAVTSQTIAEGEKIVKPTEDPTKEGHTFVGWYAVADGTGEVFNFDFIVTKDLTLHAIWTEKIKTYTVTFDTDGGSEVKTQIIIEGKKIVNPTTPSKKDQIFLGWTTTSDGTDVVFDFNTTVTKDLVLYAIWRESTYTVTFDTDGGSEVKTQIIIEGEKIVRPTNDPTKDGQVFVGWYAVADGTGVVFDFDTTVTKDLILYAIWRERINTIITFDTDGGSSEERQIVVEGEKIVKPINDPTKDGYVFVGWYAVADGTGVVFDFNTTVTKEALTIYAIWRIKTYTVTFDTDGGSSEASQIVVEGEKIVRPTNDPTKGIYIFMGWTTTSDGTDVVFDFNITVTKDLVLYAIWRIKTYTVTFDTDGGSAIASQIVAEGEKIVPPINPTRNGQVFVGWTITSDGTGAVFDFNTTVTRDLSLYAIWSIKTYTITFNTDGGSAIESQIVVAGKKIVNPINPARDGHIFLGWYTTADGAGEVFDFNIAVTRDLSLYAIWRIKTYIITFDTDGGSSEESQIVSEGKKIVKPINDPTKDGQIFVRWTTTADGTGAVFDFNTTVTRDLSLYAIWRERVYMAVTFDTDGGSTIASQRVAEGEKIVPPINPTKSGYVFVGWYATADGTGGVFDFNTTVTKDLTIYAIWIEKVYRIITFDTDGGSTIASQRVAEGEKIVKPNDPTKSGHVFGGWSTTSDGTGGVFDFNTTVTKDLTIYVIWFVKTYTITFNANGGSTGGNQIVAEGKKIVKPTNSPTNGNLIFVGWHSTLDGTGGVFDFNTVVTSNLTLYAIWTAKTYTITFETNGGSSVASQIVAEGGKIVKPNDPTRSGQTFVRWSTNADGTGGVFDFNNTATIDLTLYAIWRIKTYTITFNTDGGSAIPNQTIDKGGKIVKPTDPTRSSQTFVGWTTTADSTGDAFDFETAVTIDLTLYAIWGYTVVFDTDGGSSEESQRVAEGKKIVKPTNDPTKSGQNFVKWSITADGTGDTFNFDTAVTTDLTLYAIWMAKTYTVTFNTDGGSSEESQIVAEGKKIVKPANDPTKGNLTFVGWTTTTDGTGVIFDFNTAVTTDLTLYAIWMAKTYTITFNTNGGSSEGSQRVAEGGKIVKPTDPTRSGQNFVGWYANAVATGDAFDFNTAVTEDLTLNAIWMAKTYTVTFNTDGGSSEESQIVAEGGKIMKPTDPTGNGQNFVGWYANDAATGDAFDFNTVVTSNLTLYAIWGYKVVFETNGGDSVPNQIIREEGKKVTFIGANQASKAFVWWYTKDAFDDVNNRYDFDKVVTGDITLYAKWDEASRYTMNGNKMTYISGASGIVEIPYSVAGSLVTAVETGENNSIFVLNKDERNTTVTQIILPNSITKIGDFAFYFCSSLTSITIPDSVTSIGDFAFNVCSSLTSITIPDSVTSIGDSAFNRCNALRSITISDSVTSIGKSAFDNCISLTSIAIPNSVTSIGVRAFRACKALTSITIPDSVTSIGNEAFFTCSSLTSITIPDSVTSIGDSTFSDCSRLTSITIPDSVTSIGDSAFGRCSALRSITIPDSVTSIKEGTFSSCTALTSITIPDGVTSIGDSAFYNCTTLTSITIPDSVTSIGGFAFLDCKVLRTITIPNSVKSIGVQTFRNCTSLTSVTISDSVTSIGNGAFQACRSLTSVTIGNSVRSIESAAFYDCDSLRSITIPNSVESIDRQAFAFSGKLASVRVEATIPPIFVRDEKDVFDGTSRDLSITVPAASLEAYKTNTFWSTYADRITGY